MAYYAHVLFSRTDFPADPDNAHLRTYKRIRACVCRVHDVCVCPLTYKRIRACVAACVTCVRVCVHQSS